MKSPGGVSQQYLGAAANAALERAFEEAGRFKDEYVSTEHLFLGIAALDRDPAAEILSRHGATRDAILQALAAVRGSHRVTSPTPESTYRALEQYARDLNELARRGRLDPVIGRDDEIRRVRRALPRAAEADRRGARRAARGGQQPQGPLAGGEGGHRADPPG